MISQAFWLSLKCDCKSATAALHSASIEGSPNAGPSTKSCNMSLSQCTIGHRAAHSRNVAARVRDVCTSKVYPSHFRLIHTNKCHNIHLIEQHQYGKRPYMVNLQDKAGGQSERKYDVDTLQVSNLERLNRIPLGPSKLTHGSQCLFVFLVFYFKQPQATEYPPGLLSLVLQSSSPCVLPTMSPNQPTD